MKRILALCLLFVLPAIGQDADFRRQIQSTTLTRQLLQKTTAQQIRDLLNVSDVASELTVKTNLASLAAHTGATNRQVISVIGNAVAGDWGDQVLDYVLDESSTAETNIFAIANAGGSGRWLHKWNGDPAVFGADRTGVADSTTKLQEVIDFAGPRNLPIYLFNGEFKITTNLFHGDNLRLYGPGQIVGYFNSTKPRAMLRTTNSAFPTWADSSHTIYATNVEIVGVTFRKPTGYTGPMLLTSGVRGLLVENCRFEGKDHDDWALTIGAVDFRILGNFLDVGNAVFQDGIHVWWGRDGVIAGNQGESGDDFIALSTYDNGITNIVVMGNQGRSTHGHLLRVNPDKYLSSLPAPVNGIRNILVDGLYGETGFPPKNGGIRMEDFNYGTYQFDPTNGPGRAIQNVTLKNISVKTYGITNGFGFAIEIMGGDGITLDNVKAQGPWSALACVGVSNFVVRNSHFMTPNWTNVSFPTVRFAGYIAGGSGAPLNNAYPNYNVTLENNRIEALRDGIPGLSMANMTNVTKIIGNEITTVGSTYNPIYLSTFDEMEIHNNILRGDGANGILAFGRGNSLTLFNNRYEGSGTEIQLISSVLTNLQHYANLKAQANEWQTPQAMRALAMYATNGYFNRVNLPTTSVDTNTGLPAASGSLYTDSSFRTILLNTNRQFLLETTETAGDTELPTFGFRTGVSRPTAFATAYGDTGQSYIEWGGNTANADSPSSHRFYSTPAANNTTTRYEVARARVPASANDLSISAVVQGLTSQILTVGITNATTNTSHSLTVNGEIRYWGYSLTSTTMVIGASETLSASNLHAHLVAYPYSNTVATLSSTNVIITALPGNSITSGYSGDWAVYNLTTNLYPMLRLRAGPNGSGPGGSNRVVFLEY